MAPDDWESSHPCDKEPEELENIWNMHNCIWLTMGSIMGQGCDILPKYVVYPHQSFIQYPHKKYL